MEKEDFRYYAIDEFKDNEVVKLLKKQGNDLLKSHYILLETVGEFFNKVVEYSKNKKEPKLDKILEDFEKKYNARLNEESEEPESTEP